MNRCLKCLWEYVGPKVESCGRCGSTDVTFEAWVAKAMKKIGLNRK